MWKSQICFGTKQHNPNFHRFRNPGKFCNEILTEILTEVPISHSLTEFNQPFNR